MDLNDKIAIVTGSARGIGRAIADKMAAYGATVDDNRPAHRRCSAARHPNLRAAHPERHVRCRRSRCNADESRQSVSLGRSSRRTAGSTS